MNGVLVPIHNCFDFLMPTLVISHHEAPEQWFIQKTSYNDLVLGICLHAGSPYLLYVFFNGTKRHSYAAYNLCELQF